MCWESIDAVISFVNLYPSRDLVQLSFWGNLDHVPHPFYQRLIAAIAGESLQAEKPFEYSISWRTNVSSMLSASQNCGGEVLP